MIRCLACMIALSLRLAANDGSAMSTPAGGIQLTREPRVSMEKEVLTISLDRVTVEYEFLNQSDGDITTEVAFPLAPNHIDAFFTGGGERGVENFRLWVDGRELPYQTEAKAMLQNADRSAELRKLRVDIASFGHFDGEHAKDVQRLAPADRAALKRVRLIDEDGVPMWSVLLTYHWRQTFPAHRILHVRHEYKPAAGLAYVAAKDFADDGEIAKDYGFRLNSVCVDPALRARLQAAAPANQSNFGEVIDTAWVDYILTTANTWKTPIKHFDLIIRKPRPEAGERYLVSLCWDGKLEAKGDTFVATESNFIPKRELRVAFFKLKNSR